MKSKIKSIVFTVFTHFLKRKMNSQSIYLTFDDGPYPDNTLAILKILKKSNTKASFFMLGVAMEKHPDIVKEVINQGHTLGYHSYRHLSLKNRSVRDIAADIAHMNRLAKMFEYPIKLYRPPYGDLTIMAILHFVFKGKKIIMWSLDSRDSFEELDEVRKIISPERVSKGEIILFHDDYDHAEQLITEAIQNFRQANINCDAL